MIAQGVHHFLVDESGRVSMRMREPPCAQSDLDSLWRVRDLGHVEYLWVNGHVRVRWRPSLTTDSSRNLLMRWLANDRPIRGKLSYLVDDRWEDEVVGPTQALMHRIDQIMARFGGGELGCSLRRPCAMRASYSSRGYSEAINYWRTYRDDFDPERALSTLGHFLAERHALLELQPSGEYFVRELGGRRLSTVQKWLQASVGSTMSATPDAFFGKMCTQAYLEAQTAGEPRFDEVDALVSWPVSGRLRHRYRRLTLPFTSGSRRWVVTGYTLDSSIRLLA